MATESYLLGTKVKLWRESDVKNISFVVTEDCNLVCKYCYITGKNKKNKMNFETAKKAVDYILIHPEEFPESSVVWEFIGGEPFLEIELIDQISEYIKSEMVRLDHKWADQYRFNFSSNGLLYGTSGVQDYISKNKNHINIGLSVDGNRIKHDQQRIKRDGSGSYDEIVKNVPLWLKQFPNASTKATFASSDLEHLKDSIISLWDLGIRQVSANVVFEDTWQQGDDLILEEQLKEVADFIIENKLWETHNCTFFSDKIGFPLSERQMNKNWCGAGKMLAIDYQGKFYPCVRFIDYSLNSREGYVIGDIENGYEHDKLRPFLALDLKSQSTEECINCQVASGCAWCQGFNYDEATIDTIYERKTYNCKMHKARVRANDYYWALLKEEAGLERSVYQLRKKYLYMVLADNSTRYCNYQPGIDSGQKMDLAIFKQGLEFARKNFITPVLLLPPGGLTAKQKEILKGLEAIQVHEAGTFGEGITVYDHQKPDELKEGINSILILKKEQLSNLSELIQNLAEKHSRVNLILEGIDLFTDNDLALYEQELVKVAQYLVGELSKGRRFEVSVLTDRLFLDKMGNCNAGLDSFTLSPDGKFYLCPAFYFAGGDEAVGDIDNGINFNYQEFLTVEKSPVCSSCDAYQCRRCIYHNQMRTREYLIPAKIQCVISHIERKVSQKLAQVLHEQGNLLCLPPVEDMFPEIDYYDPLEKVYQK